MKLIEKIWEEEKMIGNEKKKVEDIEIGEVESKIEVLLDEESKKRKRKVNKLKEIGKKKSIGRKRIGKGINDGEIGSRMDKKSRKKCKGEIINSRRKLGKMIEVEIDIGEGEIISKEGLRRNEKNIRCEENGNGIEGNEIGWEKVEGLYEKELWIIKNEGGRIGNKKEKEKKGDIINDVRKLEWM